MYPNNNLDIKNELEKTLSINGEMQRHLRLMREKLEKLLLNVKDTYEANEVLLKEGILSRRCKGVGIKGAYLKGGTFYLKGNMFFKDVTCRNCPNNEDYERRKKEQEMFPMDLNLKSKHVWSTPDKQGIVLGIKEQVIDYLAQSSTQYGRRNKEIDSEKLAKLLNMVPDDFRIDWDYISSHNLLHRHSAKTCEAIWNLYLHPSLKRSAWSEKENHQLLAAAKKYNFQNWEAIAQEVGQRSDFQCFVQYQSNVCNMLPESYTKWSKEDDKRLLDVIAKNTVNGIINWSNVNAYFPHKAKTTLHSRYNFTLNPDIRRGAQFTPEEDLLLIAAVKEYGKKFSCIPRSLFPNRSLIQLRSHYNNVLSKRHKIHPWSVEDDIKLIDFVTEKGTKAWLECEQLLNGRHSRASCRTRFLTIKRYLEKNPDGGIENLPRKHVKITSSININNWKQKVDELSLNTNDKMQKPSKTKQLEEIKPIPAKIQSTEENIRSPNENKPKTKLLRKNETTYINRLRTIEINNYNFFKYAYNFQLSQNRNHDLQIKNDDFAIVLSALNVQIPLSKNGEFNLSVPEHVKQYLMGSISQLSTNDKLKLLPPSWSTAMGFRALCINSAVISPNSSSGDLTNNTSNNHIRRFRERLRLIFYSTALLSRLDPCMVGITTAETEASTPRSLKRKRTSSVDDEEEFVYEKSRRDDLIDDVKTEFET